MKNTGSLFYKPKPRDKEIKAKRWRIGSILWRAVTKACTAIGAMILLSVLLSTLLVTFAGKSGGPLPGDMVLVFKIEEGISEVPIRPTLLDPFPFNKPTMRSLVDAIDKAAEDRRVRGIVFSFKGGHIGIAQAQELRTALKRFKESGKFTKIYAASYMEGSGGLGQYFLASAFDEIWMQPVGMVSMSGPDMSMPFAKDALEKVGVNASFYKREEFKSAMENFTDAHMSKANYEMMDSLIGNLGVQMLNEAALDRKLDMVTMAMQVDKGILTGNEALAAGLIDRLDYADVMVSEIRKAATGNPDDESVELVDIAHYALEKRKPVSKVEEFQRKAAMKNVALVYVVGTIVDHADASGTAGADEISQAITEATMDEGIKAIVVRVDSPGGSPTASETIRRAIVKAKEKGKNVVVSMGSVAASGGYWVATDADKIFALDGTLTGSIGVVMGKFEASELWKKIGVNWEGPQMGGNADIWSINKPFDEAAAERMNVVIDATYNQFLTRVAEGRKMEKEKVREIARGRAWTGQQAKLNGLVDEIGGLDAALDYTATLVAGDGKTRRDIKVIRMPRELKGIERFIEMMGESAALGNFFKADSKFSAVLRGVLHQAMVAEQSGYVTTYDPALEAFR